MGVLSKDEILSAIKEKEIIITPYDETAIGAASIDLRLGNEFRIFPNHSNNKDGGIDNNEPKSILVSEETKYQDYSELFTLGEGETFTLEPGALCLAITEETIELSPKYCGLLQGRSRFARLGLFIHVSSNFMNPGIKNKQVLEIYNCSNNKLILKPGVRICQFVFMELKGTATYHGRYENNKL